MKYRRLVPAVVGVSLAFLATVALVGRSLSDTGSVELGEDGEWYYGSFIPQLDYSNTKAALASGTAPAASSPLTATFVPSKPPKAKAFEAKQGVTKEGEKHGQHVFAAQTSAAANGVAKKGEESGIHGSTILPAAYLPSAKDIRKQKIDLTLAVLQAQARELGINTVERNTQLDDLPGLNLETGIDRTAAVHFPVAKAGRHKTMLSHSEEEEQEDNDNSHKLEKAGVNVHAGIGDQVVSDHSVPVEKIVREAKKAEGQDVKTFITDAQEDSASEEQIAEHKKDKKIEREHENVDKAVQEHIREEKAEDKAADKAVHEHTEKEQTADQESKDVQSADSGQGADAGSVLPESEQAGSDEDSASPESSVPLPLTSPLHQVGLHVRTGALFQLANQGEKLYAPAYSSDYLEPQKHQRSYQAAWKWASDLRASSVKASQDQQKAAMQQYNGPKDAYAADAVSGIKHDVRRTSAGKSNGQVSADPSGKSQKRSVHSQELAMSPAQIDEVKCPWYGCPDGSHANFNGPEMQVVQLASVRMTAADRQIAPAGTHQSSLHAHAASRVVTSRGKKTAMIGGGVGSANKVQALHLGSGVGSASKVQAHQLDSGVGSASKVQALHLAHGYGTTNAYTAKPLKAPKNQYYGGDHTYFGSERPVTSQSGVVNGKQPHANDMQEAYDMHGPTSFDSVPLAEASTFSARVAAMQPSGDGKLDYNVYRGTVLAEWRKYEHGLSQCMQAEATLDPTLKDYSCKDVRVGLAYLRDCMQHHEFGLQQLTQAPSKKGFWRHLSGHDEKKPQDGAWSVLPTLLQRSRMLEPDDYKTVYGVLSNSAVFTAMWRMENLHARCASTGSAYVEEGPSRTSYVQSMDREIFNMDRSLQHDYPGTQEQQRGEARIQGAYKGTPWEWNSVRRGSYRNYWPHVMSKKPDNTKPNLFTGEYYGKENGWKPTVLNPASVPRHELPRWRVPMGDGPNPAGPTGTYGDYIMVQPRSRLAPNTVDPAKFPVRVNGRSVDPEMPRPFQVSSGAYSPYNQHYTWSGPGPYDYVPLAHPSTVRAGYNHPTTLWPPQMEKCLEDRQCGPRSVCGSAGVCVEWDSQTEAYRAPANGGFWPTDATPDWV